MSLTRSSANDRELTLAAIERDAVIANQIRLALQRLQTREYGVCLSCHKENKLAHDVSMLYRGLACV